MNSSLWVFQELGVVKQIRRGRKGVEIKSSWQEGRTFKLTTLLLEAGLMH